MPSKNIKINFNSKIANIKTDNKRLILTQKQWVNQWCQLGAGLSVLLNNNFNPKQSVWGNLNGYGLLFISFGAQLHTHQL